MSNEKFLKDKTMVVFGGLNGWGQKIAQTAEGLTKKVLIVDKDTSEQDAVSAVRSADVIFLATPDERIKGIINTIRAELKGKVILDCATNKSGFMEDLKEVGQEASVTSTHPMVMSQTSTRGQNVLIMPVGNQPEKATQAAQEIFGELQMKIRDFLFEQHGPMMALLQFDPHLIQRAQLKALQIILAEKGLTIQDLEAIAPANFLLTELAMGRVAIQKPSVSAGIVEEALKFNFGQRVLDVLKESIDSIKDISDSRADLEKDFNQTLKALDPDGSWVEKMRERTEIQVEAMGNLRMRSFHLTAEKDEPGLFLKIADVLHRHHINMTAIHSHFQPKDDGGRKVRFDIGIENGIHHLGDLQREFEALGLGFKRSVSFLL